LMVYKVLKKQDQIWNKTTQFMSSRKINNKLSRKFNVLVVI